MQIDPRIINLGIQIGGSVKWYRDLYIDAKGVKFSNPNMGECEITILNLSRGSREQILRETNPLTSTGKIIGITLEVGRQSYGTATLFTGQIFRSEPTAKPDIGVRLKCLGSNGRINQATFVSRSGKALTRLSSIAQWVAEDCGYKLSFEIEDKNIGSYSFSGSAQAQILKLEDLANADVFVDASTLYVKESNRPTESRTVRKLSVSSGLISAGGTESGAKMTMLYDPITNIGSQIDLVSSVNPSITGSYVVYRLDYNVSTRIDPFYLSAECRRI